MKTIKTLLTLSVFFFATFSVAAQNADDIISKYLQTINGDKLKTLKGLKMEMTVSVQGMEFPLEIVQQTGGKMYVKIKVQGKEMTQMASDGNTIWMTDFSTMKPQKADAEATANSKLSNIDFPDPFLDYKAKGYQAEYQGTETKNGTETYKIKLTKKPITLGGVQHENVFYYYFDTAKNWPIATEMATAEGIIPQSTLGNYQAVEGIYFPFAMNQSGQDVVVRKITLNPVVDEKAFAYPGE